MSDRAVQTAAVASLALNPSVWGGGFLVFLALRFEPPGVQRWIVTAIAVVFVAVVPIGLLFVLKSYGYLSDIEMRNRSERQTVYLVCAGSYAIGAFSLVRFNASWPVWGLVGLHAPYALVLAAANRRWKVSVHTVGLAGVFAAALVLFGIRALPLLAVPLLGGWARWAARAHTLGELVGGALIGFVLTGGGLYLLRFLVAG